MKNDNLIESISKKGNGEIYLGVVGAVRTGKSTFIKRFIERMVIPNMEDEYEKKKCLDEIPQCGQGKAIMTTEPKFVPSMGANVKVDEYSTKITLVDCVGYVIDDASGFNDEDGNPRLVKCPWKEDYIPLAEAAEIGTKKVICDHATIGIVVTSDGSITEFERESYISAEERVIKELKECNKPFIVVLNSKSPDSSDATGLADKLTSLYDVPVIPCNCDKLTEKDIRNILKTALNEFPIESLNINMPAWINELPEGHTIKDEYLLKVKDCIKDVNKLKDADEMTKYFENTTYISKAYISDFDAGRGTVTLNLDSDDEIFKDALLKIVGEEEISKSSLLNMFVSYKENNEELKSIKDAIRMAKNTGYGIVYPTISDMMLDEPEITKVGSRFGVKLKAKSSSIHMIKVDVESTFEPIIGSEEQSKDVINYIMKDYENDKNSIWHSEIFGRSLDDIVREGINSKLLAMSDSTRLKLSNTVTKIVNKGANNLIAIVI